MYLSVACECESAGIAARALANIADVLGSMADGQGGMRSGPAGNTQWAPAFDFLEVKLCTFDLHSPLMQNLV